MRTLASGKRKEKQLHSSPWARSGPEFKDRHNEIGREALQSVQKIGHGGLDEGGSRARKDHCKDGDLGRNGR